MVEKLERVNHPRHLHLPQVKKENMVKDLIPKVNGISIVKKIKDVKNLYKMKLPKKKLKELLTRCQKDLVEMLINTNNLFPKEMIRRVGKL